MPRGPGGTSRIRVGGCAPATTDRRPTIERKRIVLVEISQPERAVEYGRIVGMLS